MAGFIWQAFFPQAMQMWPELTIGIVSAGLALVTIAVSLVLYFIPTKNQKIGALIIYSLLLASAAWLIIASDSSFTPFMILWTILAIFAGVFGWRMVVDLMVLVIVLSFTSFYLNDQSNYTNILPVLLIQGLLPLGLSFLIWHRPPASLGQINTNQLKSSELHRVTGQSEIVINAIGDGVVAVDSRGTVQLMNPAAENLIGWRSTDAVSLNYQSILKLGTIEGEDLPPSLDPIHYGLNSNQQYRTSDISLLTKAGKRLIISMVVSPVGEVGSGVIVTFRDITKEKTEERQQAEFISTASHEMRTPVASIEGYLGLALNPAIAQVDEKARDYIQKAHEATQHLGRLFQDLLDITKAEDGRLKSTPTLIDTVEFSRDVAGSLKTQAEAKGLRLNFKPDAREAGERQLHPVYHINQDKDHLREVIANLIENAIKYTPKGEVEVDIAGNEDEVVVSIRDSGIGIPAEDIPHLFQKFYRVDSSDTREIGGTGLGLYLCRQLVESMNGRLWVESQPKRGSVFYVALPRLSSTEAAELQNQAEAAAASKPKEFNQSVPAAPVTYTAPQATEIPPQAAPAPQPLVQPTLSQLEQNPALYQHRLATNYTRKLSIPRQRPGQNENRNEST